MMQCLYRPFLPVEAVVDVAVRSSDACETLCTEGRAAASNAGIKHISQSNLYRFATSINTFSRWFLTLEGWNPYFASSLAQIWAGGRAQHYRSDAVSLLSGHRSPFAHLAYFFGEGLDDVRACLLFIAPLQLELEIHVIDGTHIARNA
jgi:hypothetical protein